MMEVLPELLLVAVLVIVNAILAGSEIALISLREAQLARLERSEGAGPVVVRLARDPNRFLATIQIGITLAGFGASAAAAVTLAEPLVPYFDSFGGAANTAAIVTVTLVLSFFTLVLGELAPKRLALQFSERWSLLVARPLTWLATVSKPAVWLLSQSTDVVVRIFGGRPDPHREQVGIEEMREMVVSHHELHTDHQDVLVGAFEVADRTVGAVMTPRTDVFTIRAGTPVETAIRMLADAGHSRAPMTRGDGGLDTAFGIVGLIDLVAVDPAAPADVVAAEPIVLPETVAVLSALRTLQERRQQMLLVVDEFGGIAGIVTAEDLVEELVGEIYDESDRDVVTAVRQADGSVVVPGRFPIHDLVDVGVAAPTGDYRTVGGLVADRLGRMAAVGDTVQVEGWDVIVEAVADRAVAQARFRPRADDR